MVRSALSRKPAKPRQTRAPARKRAAPNAAASTRAMVRAWAETLPSDDVRHSKAQAIIGEIIERYADALEIQEAKRFARTPSPAALPKTDATMRRLAQGVAETVLSLSEADAIFEIGTLYTIALPQRFRSEHGVFYTPPQLTKRLLDMAEAAGVDWRKARIIDPACGGGAFLAPVAERLVKALADCLPSLVLQNIAGRIRGLELDPFAAWISQVSLEITLRNVTRAAGRALPQLVTVCDSLDEAPPADGFDLVIGNPPFGRVSLSAEQRKRYARSLYGHANLYGVFLDLAVRWSKPTGVIAFVTPTSFLSGEYFKELRALLAREAPPCAVEVVADRKGVFEDVLQETMLSAFRRGGRPSIASVRALKGTSSGAIVATDAGALRLPTDPRVPWLLARHGDDAKLVKALNRKRTRLSDWGYGVSTGPLVWNRHKTQLCDGAKGALPLIWAESVSADGAFAHRAERRNHAPYFKPTKGDDWLITKEPCVLLQRTTAKEQSRRLIAAELPLFFIEAHGAVVVENHLNMVRPNGGAAPKVSPAALAAVLNSVIVDRAFRCISGSVAVSASELEALPLPTVKQMAKIERLVVRGAVKAEIEMALSTLYLGVAS
jgi:adenine-specific DNA-methyltransferase